MGDGADYNDIERFLKSTSGKVHLDHLRRSLVNRTITSVRLENNTQNIKTIITFENGSRFFSIQPCHDVDVLRELFGDEIELERLKLTGG